MNKVRLIELFGGIGACTQAIKRLGKEVEILDYVEIDKYAVASYNAINGTNFETQDIKTWNKHFDDVDLIMHGSPCQDFSLAGKQAGGDEGSGTRSSLMYETLRIVKDIKPKYVIWENVKNLLSVKHKHNFDAYIESMNELGYTSYYKVLNAKDFGIPQNRERVFTISIRNDLSKTYVFPESIELKLKLKDLLEKEVDEKYYLSDKMINYVCSRMPSGEHHITTGIHIENKDSNGLAGTICTEPGNKPSDNFIIDNDNYEYSKRDGCIKLKEYKNYITWENQNGTINTQDNRAFFDETISGTVPTSRGIPKVLLNSEHLNGQLSLDDEVLYIKNATKQGYLEAKEGDGIDISSRMDSHRGTVQKESCQTITCQGGNNVGVVVKDERNLKEQLCDYLIENDKVKENGEKEMSKLRIRKLTPKECWRLMGFDDECFDKAKQVNSDSQLYKQAGNSIVVNVLEKILGNLLED